MTSPLLSTLSALGRHRRSPLTLSLGRWVTFVVSCGLSLCTLCACREEPPPSAPSPELKLSQERSLAWGRVTALLWRGEALWTGHEGGWVARWELSASSHEERVLRASWLAHEGAIRSLEAHEEGVRSVGGDGSWAWWSSEGRLIRRERAPQLKANAATPLSDGSWLIASDRGVISRVKGGARLWRTAGEHRRAAFDLEVTGAELLSVGSDGWLRRWRVSDGEMVGARAAHEGWATALLRISAPRSEGAQELWLTGGADGFVRLWPSDVARAQLERPPVEGTRGHDADLTRLAGAWPWVVSGGEDGRLSLYKLELGARGAELRHVSQAQALSGPVMSLQMRGSCVTVGGGRGARDLAYYCIEGGALKRRPLRLHEGEASQGSAGRVSAGAGGGEGAQ